MTWKDRLVALAIVAVWGFNFVVIKWGVSGIPPFLLGGLRFSAVVALGMSFVRRPAIPWRWLALYGLTVGFLQFACLFTAIRVGMPPGLASIVQQSQAFFTMLIALVWQKERFSGWQLSGLLVGGSGLWLIGGMGVADIPLLGFVLTLLGALSWAVSNVVVRAIVRAGYQPDVMGMIVWSGLFPIAPFFLVAALLEPSRIVLADVLTVKSLFAVGYLAVISTLFGYGQWSKLLSRHPANLVAPYSLLIPLVAVLSSWLLLGERLSFWQVTGGTVLLSGLAINVLGPRLMALWRKPAAAQ
ncbi:membrane protein [Sorangium cellulosum]|uniref:Membrane protein n=1 Tax=Sorangium cellulosum TaxID=56 RepID=A0A2L0EIG2_SORCE|nr:EamA family transporter [Sorangium cellulosum]AUX39080.1 membrane protein [Sorangium cellulosum]